MNQKQHVETWNYSGKKILGVTTLLLILSAPCQAQNSHDLELGANIDGAGVAQARQQEEEEGQPVIIPHNKTQMDFGNNATAGTKMVEVKKLKVTTDNEVGGGIETKDGGQVSVGDTGLTQVKAESVTVDTRNRIKGTIEVGQGDTFKLGTVNLENHQGQSVKVSSDNTLTGNVKTKQGSTVSLGNTNVGGVAEQAEYMRNRGSLTDLARPNGLIPVQSNTLDATRENSSDISKNPALPTDPNNPSIEIPSFDNKSTADMVKLLTDYLLSIGDDVTRDSLVTVTTAIALQLSKKMGNLTDIHGNSLNAILKNAVEEKITKIDLKDFSRGLIKDFLIDVIGWANEKAYGEKWGSFVWCALKQAEIVISSGGNPVNYLISETVFLTDVTRKINDEISEINKNWDSVLTQQAWSQFNQLLDDQQRQAYNRAAFTGNQDEMNKIVGDIIDEGRELKVNMALSRGNTPIRDTFNIGIDNQDRNDLEQSVLTAWSNNVENSMQQTQLETIGNIRRLVAGGDNQKAREVELSLFGVSYGLVP